MGLSWRVFEIIFITETDSKNKEIFAVNIHRLHNLPTLHLEYTFEKQRNNEIKDIGTRSYNQPLLYPDSFYEKSVIKED